MSESIRLAWAGLSPDRVEQLVSRHGSIGAAVAAIVEGREVISPEIKSAVSVSSPERWAGLGDLGFVECGDVGYPKLLTERPDRPRWLFCRGVGSDAEAVAVVGSRAASSYGITVAESVGKVLAMGGFNVVSGLAAGIDGAAHRGALSVGGTTTAVLGSGIDVWYPRRHVSLGEAILESGGSVLSEFPPETRPDAWRFPTRNRIIAGMVTAVVVVEAAERSGALITARYALDSGIDVLAVPGDIDRPTSVGTNRLIRDGAIPIGSLDELLEALGYVPVGAGDSVHTVEELMAEWGLSVSETLARIAREEQGGRARFDGERVFLARTVG